MQKLIPKTAMIGATVAIISWILGFIPILASNDNPPFLVMLPFVIGLAGGFLVFLIVMVIAIFKLWRD